MIQSIISAMLFEYYSKKHFPTILQKSAHLRAHLSIDLSISAPKTNKKQSENGKIRPWNGVLKQGTKVEK